MTRKVNLIDFLPPVLQEYAELQAVLHSESREMELLWAEIRKILDNHSITTADAGGTARYEKMLHLFPSASEPLEARKSAVLAKWNNALPYTVRSLKSQLDAILGAGGYIVQMEGYVLSVYIALENKEKNQVVKNLLGVTIPKNMVIQLGLIYNTWEDAAAYAWGHAEGKNMTWEQARSEVLS